jgi:hypothetical protein
MCGISFYPISPDDISSDVTCEVEECDSLAFHRATMAGHPAGEWCTTHAKLMADRWFEFTGEKPKRLKKVQIQTAVAA